jgi:hypothetical protein
MSLNNVNQTSPEPETISIKSEIFSQDVNQTLGSLNLLPHCGITGLEGENVRKVVLGTK